MLKPLFWVFTAIMAFNWLNVLFMMRKSKQDSAWAEAEVPGCAQFGLHVSRARFVRFCLLAAVVTSVGLAVFGVVIWT